MLIPELEKHLADGKRRYGALNRHTLVGAARDKASPLYKLFDWTNLSGHDEQLRPDQAENILRQLGQPSDHTNLKEVL